MKEVSLVIVMGVFATVALLSAFTTIPEREEAKTLTETATAIHDPWERFLALRGRDPDRIALSAGGCGTSTTAIGAHYIERGCDSVRAWWRAQHDALRAALAKGEPAAREYVFAKRADDPWLDDLREEIEPGSTARRTANEAEKKRLAGEAAAFRDARERRERIAACRWSCEPYEWTYSAEARECSCASATSSSEPLTSRESLPFGSAPIVGLTEQSSSASAH